jgi:hypothetical protein
MSLPTLANSISDLLNKKYNGKIETSNDLSRINNLCKLYKDNKKHQEIDDISIDSPSFHSYQEKIADALDSPEFTKKYSFFIKVIYACLKIKIPIFDEQDNIIVFLNNQNILKNIELSRKEITNNHINVLRNLRRKTTRELVDEYRDYASEYANKLKIMEQVKYGIQKMITNGVVLASDNLLNLLIPYFYHVEEYIEEYN